MRYRVRTASDTYGGKTYGIRFANGQALFDDLTIDQKIGLSAEEIARRMEHEFGYTVEKLNDNGTPFMEPEPKKK